MPIYWFNCDNEPFQFHCRRGLIHIPSLAEKLNLRPRPLDLNGVTVDFDIDGYLSLADDPELLKGLGDTLGVSPETAISVVGQPADPMSRFTSLLTAKPKELDEKVMARVAVDFASQVLTVQDSVQAKLVYNRALALPGTSTKLIAEQKGIAINGDFLPNVPSKSALVYAFQGTKPVLLKLARSDNEAEHESCVWQQLCSGEPPPHLAGPITRLPLQDKDGNGRVTLLMPIYPATLQHVPCLTPDAALKIGGQIKQGLQHMHSRNLVHCDVKPPNIFINDDGDAFLGDYGAVRKLGEAAEEKTGNYVPFDPPEGINVDDATFELDFLLLAVTLLERMRLLQIGSARRQLSMGSVMAAVGQVPHKELRDFIEKLVTPQHVSTTS